MAGFRCPCVHDFATIGTATTMCVQGCQTFIWGGAGTANFDEHGACTCACEGEGWSEGNILGVASCVPRRAHLIFGAVGLATSVIGLWHAAYQLRRQVKYHARRFGASTSSTEKCRRNLHIVAITHACITLVFFSLVLVLHAGQLWASAFLVSGIIQFTTNIGGFLTIRMWIYTNDPRLMQDTPEMLAISNALEQPVKRYASYIVVCLGAVVATILTVTTHSQAAVKVASVAFLGLIVSSNVVILKCGTSLVRTIDRSLNEPRRKMSTSATASESAQGERGVDSSRLLAARKKTMFAMEFCLVTSLLTDIALIFAAFTTYGTAAPLVFFGLPMGFAPTIWFVFNIQLHAGRSNLRGSPGLFSGTATQYPRALALFSSGRNLKLNATSNSKPVVPTDFPTSP